MSRTPTKSQSIWAARVREWRASGETAKQFAEGHGYNAATLSWWASRLRNEQPRFVQLVRQGPSAERVPMITVEVGAAQIRVGSGFDAKLLGEVVAALGGGQ